jgi:hypothetical protein
MVAGIVGLTLMLAGQAPVGAQATRTWVSGVGDDANPCNRTAPCKTFAGAISKTAASGEINTMDPGGFGAVTITKSITIASEGVVGGILSSLVNGINVNDSSSGSPNSIVVVLRGLDIEGAGNGTRGISVSSAKAVFVENVTIGGVGGAPGHGIDVTVPGALELYLSNVDIRNSAGSGVRLDPAVGGSVKASIDNSRIENNAVGLEVRENSKVTIRNSVVSGNTNAGLLAQPDSATADLNAESVVVSNNGVGIQAGGAAGTGSVRIANTMVYGNGTGITIVGGSQVISFTNNMIFGNTAAGQAPTTTPLQ